MGCLKLKKFLFIAALLLVFALPHLSAQSVYVPLKTLKELQGLNWSLQSQIEYIENELTKAETELSKSKTQQTELLNLIETLKTDLETLEKQQTELMKSYLKSSKTKQIKTGFIVGGVCVVVTVAIAVPVTIFIYDKYFVK